ncbi:GTPase [Schizosaccharomyces japonicus yFS275]|uniref:GTPase n=1 Tax=Schizosaccharomyces japonicus (strain yFS275 / FY16936) TaxID=402676 RepID=B6K238_SCHJY|nr:GTPase [Schizosaccharomyces japonicus yFS275]EEB07219.1 GTPase [Schizosaccharomyces japonicus yFS275]
MFPKLWKSISSAALYKPLRRTFATKQSKHTVYALSTAPGKAAVAVIRVSGPQASEVAKTLCGSVPKPRMATLLRLLHPKTKRQIDRALVLFFPGPASFTGEDTIEFHTHGGSGVVQETLTAIAETRLPALRYAERGEFSKQAFYNGKMDLLQLESLADVIDAETAEQVYLANEDIDTQTRKRVSQWRDTILECRALLETLLDFSEEHSVEEDFSRAVLDKTRSLLNDMHSFQIRQRTREAFRFGTQAVLFGPTNAGKSSLVNSLARRQVALVSDEPGTTRDALQVQLNIHGYPVWLSDTAGLRHHNVSSAVEAAGIQLAKQRTKQSQLLFLVLPMNEYLHNSQAVTQEAKGLLRSLSCDENNSQRLLFVILNKADLLENDHQKQQAQKAVCSEFGLSPERVAVLSCLTGNGLDSFLNQVSTILRSFTARNIQNNELASENRYRQCLKDCCQHLQIVLTPNLDVTIMAEELRLASNSLEMMIGTMNNEEVLSQVFQRFCIGK